MITIVYLFIVEENGKEDLLSYPDQDGKMTPMIAVDAARLKQFREIADEMMKYMKRSYKIRKFLFNKEIKIGE